MRRSMAGSVDDMINRLPALKDPCRYAGLFIFDFGDHVSVGYTAEEIEYLLADAKYAGGKAYKIQRADADGRLEIRGVDVLAWAKPAGLVFWFDDRDKAMGACIELVEVADKIKPPGRVTLTVHEREGRELQWAMVLRYAREYEQAVSSWLLKIDYTAGVIVEGGADAISEAAVCGEVVRQMTLLPISDRRPRSREEVLGSTHYAVQR